MHTFPGSSQGAMRSGARRISRLTVAAVMALLLASAAAPRTEARQNYGAQQSGVPQMPGQPRTSTPRSVLDNEAPPDPFKGRTEAAQARAIESERHKKLVADAQRLVELSTELKAEVDKTSKDELSVTVIRKAEQIEKLAHDVKERMKN